MSEYKINFERSDAKNEDKGVFKKRVRAVAQR